MSGTPSLAGLRHLVLDLDGTLYEGDQLFPTVEPFLRQLEMLGIGHSYLTNNTSRSQSDYEMRLRELGLPVESAQVVTPAAATAAALRALHPGASLLYVLGTPSLQSEFAERGFEVAGDGDAVDPDAVVVGFDTSLTYARLCRAAWWISRGLPYYATHPDRTCPTDLPTILVDCGAICAALEVATGRAPDAVLGKPKPAMLQQICHRHDLQPDQVAMVGDRLSTDIAMANRGGSVSILVLTGEASAEDVDRLSTAAEERPALVVRDLAELGALLARAGGDRDTP